MLHTARSVHSTTKLSDPFVHQVHFRHLSVTQLPQEALHESPANIASHGGLVTGVLQSGHRSSWPSCAAAPTSWTLTRRLPPTSPPPICSHPCAKPGLSPRLPAIRTLYGRDKLSIGEALSEPWPVTMLRDSATCSRKWRRHSIPEVLSHSTALDTAPQCGTQESCICKNTMMQQRQRCLKPSR